MTDSVLQPGATTEPVGGKREARLEAARAFVRRVKELERGELAMLKRNAGNTLAQSRGVTWFYRLLDQEARGIDVEIYFLIATLMGLNKLETSGDFGRSMARLKSVTESDSVERRFRILLDAEFDRLEGYRPGGGELAFRLRQLVKLAATKEVGIDWAQLLCDLRRWNDPQKRVQKCWAQSFYAPATTVQSNISATSAQTPKQGD